MLLSVDVLFRRELILLCQLIRKKTIATCAGLLEIHGFNETTSYKITPTGSIRPLATGAMRLSATGAVNQTLSSSMLIRSICYRLPNLTQ